MSPELYKFIVTLAGAAITILLAIVGYFLQKQVTVTETLIKAVNALTLTVELIQNNQDNSTANCGMKHAVIDTRLNKHSQILSEHDKAITRLETLKPVRNRNSSKKETA